MPTRYLPNVALLALLLLRLPGPANGYHVIRTSGGSIGRKNAVIHETNAFDAMVGGKERTHHRRSVDSPADEQFEWTRTTKGLFGRRNAITCAARSASVVAATATLAGCCTVPSSFVAGDARTVTQASSSLAAPNLGSGYRYGPDWTGTALPLLTPLEAAAVANSRTSRGGDNEGADPPTFPMGRWPDPILRRPATPVPPSLFGSSELTDVAKALRNTARSEGAVGLAAQQCGVDARLVWLDDVDPDIAASSGGAAEGRSWRWWEQQRRWRPRLGSGKEEVFSGDGGGGGIFLVNPRIVRRSPEVDMRVWTERCLVLPPTFSASVLRDAFVSVECETLDGETRRVHLGGEIARACQHEMDHDRGILITDHVGLEELESDDMRRLEGEGHSERMILAYARTVEEPSIFVPYGWDDVFPGRRSAPRQESVRKGLFVQGARAAEDLTFTSQLSGSYGQSCDDECLRRRRQIIEERRAMMRQSRSSVSRQDVFELSRQRAALYNTTYRGAVCPPGISCL